jgi:lysozyme
MQARSDKHLKGIDVSKWQGTIDWKKVKSCGVDFVIIKATEGQRTTDPNFLQNVKGAKEAGLKVGAYHYAHPDNDPIKEVEHFLTVTAGIELDLPPALDLEVNKGLSKAQVTNFARKWLSELEKRIGRKPLFYSYTHFIRSYIGKEVSAWPLWIAHYGVTTPGTNGVWDRWEIFQYSDSGKVAGISGNVDLNVMEPSFLVKEEQPKDDISGHWAEAEIRKVIAEGKMKGRPTGFEPDAPITRAEIAYLIAKGII